MTEACPGPDFSCTPVWYRKFYLTLFWEPWDPFISSIRVTPITVCHILESSSNLVLKELPCFLKSWVFEEAELISEDPLTAWLLCYLPMFSGANIISPRDSPGALLTEHSRLTWTLPPGPSLLFLCGKLFVPTSFPRIPQQLLRFCPWLPLD
jgi:hypothetical protein